MNIKNLQQVREVLREFAGHCPEPVHEWLAKHLIDFWVFRAGLLLEGQANLQMTALYGMLRELALAGVPLNQFQQADLYREQLCRVGVRHVEGGLELDLINQHYFESGVKHEPGYKVIAAIDELVDFLTAVYKMGGPELLVQVDPYQFHQAVIGYRAHARS